jgi:hypothetical protein
MATKKKLKKRCRKLKRSLALYKRGSIDFGDITICINPDGNEVTVIFAKPMIHTGAHSKKFGGFQFNEFGFMTEDHPSLPYRVSA